MERRAENPDQNIQRPKLITGDNVEIIIPDTEDLRLTLKHLDRIGSLEIIYDGGKNLPAPCKELSVEVTESDNDAYPALESDIYLDVDLFKDNVRYAWSDTVLKAIDEYFAGTGTNVFQVDYMTTARFISLNDTHAISVETIGDLYDGCSLKFNLTNIADIEEAAGTQLGISSPKMLDEASDVVYKYLSILTDTIDTVVWSLRDQDDEPSSPYTIEARLPDYRDTNIKVMGLLAISAPMEHHPSETNVRPIGFDQLGGLKFTISELKKIAACFKDPEGTARYGIKPSHILLHGPPGTGKTTLAEALANEIGASFQSIRSSDIMDKYIGESGKQLKKIFEDAYEVEDNLVLFFDEFDTIGGKHENSSISHKEVKKLLQEYIIETSRDHPNILICAATNADMDDMEPAMTRSGRLVPLSVPAPNESERQEIWACVISNSINDFHGTRPITSNIDAESAFVPYLTEISTEKLAKSTDGMTGADFEEILARARRFAYNQYVETGVDYQVSEADLLAIIKDFSRR